jgi:glycosyltransferase involved in cell wall biosynthesis
LASKVIFKGYVEGEKKEKLLANAKALFLPSISENFGNIIVEALAQGTPVVASLGSPWEVLEKEKSGFWIDNSPEILAKTINDIIMMGIDKYLQMRINARQLCEDKYDVFNNIKYWIAEYNRIKAN